MTIYYNATDRKPLVKAISEFTGTKPVYLKTPTYAYQIDYFTVTREGNLEFDDMADSEEIEKLIEVLAQNSFVAECSEYTSAQQERSRMARSHWRIALRLTQRRKMKSPASAFPCLAAFSPTPTWKT